MILRPIILHLFNSRVLQSSEQVDTLPYLYAPLSESFIFNVFGKQKKTKLKLSKKSTLVVYPLYSLLVSLLSGLLYYVYAYVLLAGALLSLSFYVAYASNQSYASLLTSPDRLKHIPPLFW